jgi:hypothetical protein
MLNMMGDHVTKHINDKREEWRNAHLRAVKMKLLKAE